MFLDGYVHLQMLWRHLIAAVVQAERQKAAASKAAQERAAHEYEQEVKKLNAMKLQSLGRYLCAPGLQAERQKAAAIKAAQERAAQEYEQEVSKLNAMKLQNEARINEKVKKAKQKARKKEEALSAEEVRATRFNL